MTLERERKLFAEDLRRKASKKMALVRAAKAQKKSEKPAPASVKATVLVKLNEILDLLKKGKSGGNVKFIITDRDPDGNIKSFKVENS